MIVDANSILLLTFLTGGAILVIFYKCCIYKDGPDRRSLLILQQTTRSTSRQTTRSFYSQPMRRDIDYEVTSYMDTDELEECYICMDRLANLKFANCNHTMCEVCTIVYNKDKCPYCGQKIDKDITKMTLTV
jgi:hypothetical protein